MIKKILMVFTIAAISCAQTAQASDGLYLETYKNVAPSTERYMENFFRDVDKALDCSRADVVCQDSGNLVRNQAAILLRTMPAERSFKSLRRLLKYTHERLEGMTK